MLRDSQSALVLYLIAGAVVCATPSFAQEQADSEPETGWFNSTEGSYVFTEGNSDTETLGLQNNTGKRMKNSRFEVKLNAVTSDTADDRFLLVEPGLTWQPGEDPPPGATSIVDPSTEPDVEKYSIRGFYDKTIRKGLAWRAGLNWDRDEDAGILNRYVYSGSLGNQWRDSKQRQLYTGYGLSYTDREEETPDPEKDDRFAGIKLDLDYLEKFGKTTTFVSDFGGNLSLKDSSDYSLDITNSIAVAMSNRLSLKVSLQWLYNSEPALEDVDIIAQVMLVDPDGIPGSGDEFFETVESGGTEIELGEGQIRKETLDTVFRTTLVIDF